MPRSPRVSAGQYRHRVEIQRLRQVRDGFGEVSEDDDNWETIATVSCKIDPLSGRELWNAQQVQADTTTEIEIRYFRGLSAQDRFQSLGPGKPIYNISAIVDVEDRHRKMVCSCLKPENVDS